MKLKYYTLWIENEPAWLDSTIEYVAEIVAEHGFVMYSDKCLSSAEFYEKVDKNPYFLNKFDLILTDFDLGYGDRGNVLIDSIRSNKINLFTDIIFYGQDQEAINSVLNTHFIEGVYKAPREIGIFSQKFEKVFESTIKKVQDISMMRGLVISEASEMSIRMLKLIQFYFSKTHEKKSKELRDYIFEEIIDAHVKNTSKLKAKFEPLENSQLLEDRLKSLIERR